MELKLFVYLIIGYVLFYMLKNNQLTLLFFLGCYLIYKFITRTRKPKNSVESLEREISLLRSSIEQLYTKAPAGDTLRSPASYFGNGSRLKANVYGGVKFSGRNGTLTYLEKLQHGSRLFE